MTLTDVLTELATRGALKQSRVPVMKTSLKYLAEALGHASPEACPADWACLQEASWATALEDYWRTLETADKTISAYTRRNVRNDIRKVFKLAEAHDLLTQPVPSRLLPRPANSKAFQRQQRATAPYKSTYRAHLGRSYWLPRAQWPPEIEAGWQTYRAACGQRIRETSLASYAHLLETYWGYLANVCSRTPVWDDLFDRAQLSAFVSWHSARVGRTVTVHARQLVVVSAAMAVVLKHRNAPELAAYRQGLKKPAALHIKRHHMVSLAELDEVADACLIEGRAPLVPAGKAVSFPGTRRAGCFQRGVILKLLVRVPLRQRNVREMQLDRNLWKDQATGHWHLAFAGDELKIGSRGPKVNTYEVNLSTYRPEFIPILEEWLQVHRSKLPGSATSPWVFPNQHGTPHTPKTLREELALAVALRTGKRWYPHLVRTQWATECLTPHDADEAPDWTTVAVMLGDKVGTVMASYHDLVDQAHHPKASVLLGKRLRTG